MAKSKRYQVRKNVPMPGREAIPTPTLLDALKLHAVGDFTETFSSDDKTASRRIAYNLAMRSGGKFRVLERSNGRLGIWRVA